MTGRRDPIVSRKLKLVSDLINTFENLKRANIPRAELPAGQPQLYVPRGEPDPLSWLVGRVWTPLPVSLELLCSYGSLEADVGTVPHPLTTLYPLVHSRDRRRFTRPWEQGGLKPQDALKGG